jgi:gamma-glutamylcyclotransferase
MLYLAYGSNMSSRRFLTRIPHAEHVGIGIVKDHALRFHKISQTDGSGKCDIYKTDDSSHSICGVIYRVSSEDKKILDKIEGLGVGYNEKVVEVVLPNGEKKEAFVYYAITIDPAVQPLHWYKEHVLRGALENNLPEWYIEKIKKVVSVADADEERHNREMSLYG